MCVCRCVYQRFGKATKVAHFLGPVKPWNLKYNRATGRVETEAGELEPVVDFVHVWWQIFMEDIHYRLVADLVSDCWLLVVCGAAGFGLSMLSLTPSDIEGLHVLPLRAFSVLTPRLHQHTSLNCAHRCLNQPIADTSALLCGVTLQCHAPEQRDTAKDVLLFLDQRCGTHPHCQFVTYH